MFAVPGFGYVPEHSYQLLNQKFEIVLVMICEHTSLTYIAMYVAIFMKAM